MYINGLGLNVAATTAIVNHNASDVPVQIEPAASSDSSWRSGAFTVPAYGQLSLMVMFEGGSSAGDCQTSVRILAGSGLELTVPATATVTATGLPK